MVEGYAAICGKNQGRLNYFYLALMSVPVISVVMPFLNAAPYLREAVESLLEQTFTDFECILINDGSTDDSELIISSIKDNRIRYIRNPENKGLVYSLNLGLEEAKGMFIARMDGDDISHKDRFKKQLDYLHAHPEADLVCSVVELINEKGQLTGYWKDDRNHIHAEDIRNFLPMNNCIAHPTIMARAAIIKELKYKDSQSQAEDYDLWLRWIASGHTIHKSEHCLLKHRILSNSFTRQRQQNVFYKLAATKWRFAVDEIKKGNMNHFVFRSLLFAAGDMVKGTGKVIKKNIGNK